MANASKMREDDSSSLSSSKRQAKSEDENEDDDEEDCSNLFFQTRSWTFRGKTIQAGLHDRPELYNGWQLKLARLFCFTPCVSCAKRAGLAPQTAGASWCQQIPEVTPQAWSKIQLPVQRLAS
jgi:hypothetical protein